uniref:Homing endonuclease LAGLIDADG domain-containing protein n=1 Tax=Caulerpa cliftonii TaxID=1004391 RepID=A0A1C9JBQ8_9CHLO|nr:hypothetical protein [Caulerpa cliftonii]AOP19289.1 hypothetical protein [Caulerpa cliftonii]
MNFQKRSQLILDKFNQTAPKITTKYKYFLGGFVEGEGSLCVSIKNQNQKIRIDPEFNICQHKNGIIHLIAFMFLFRTGSIVFKSGSNATYVFKITNRKSLKEKFIPFYKRFILPYASYQKNQRFYIFQSILDLLEKKVHLSKKGLAFKVLPLVFKMRSQAQARKKTLREFQNEILWCGRDAAQEPLKPQGALGAPECIAHSEGRASLKLSPSVRSDQRALPVA